MNVEPEASAEEAPQSPWDATDDYVILAKASKDDRLVREATHMLHERAQRRLKRRQFVQARDDFRGMLDLDAGSAEAHAGLGKLALAEDDLDGAMALLDRAIDLDPQLAAAFCDRGFVFLARMDPERAIADYTTAASLSTDHEVLARRGMAWIAAGNPVNALADFIQAIQLKPDETSGYLGKGLALSALRRYGTAVEACAEAIERRPEDGASYLQRSAFHAALNAPDEAIGDCDTAILLLADPAPAHAQKGFFLAATGGLEAALEEYRRAIEANPGFVQTYFSRACALSLSETAGTVVEDLKRVIGASPQFRQLALVSPELEWARNNVPEVRQVLGV